MRVFVVELDAPAQSIAPLLHPLVLEGHGVNTVLFNKWVACAFGPMDIKLFLQKCIDSRV